MPKGNYLNDDEKKEILKLSMQGVNAYNIAKIIKRHHQTISRFLSNPTDYGKCIKNAGRKPALEKREKRSIIKIAKCEKLSTRQISRTSVSGVSHCTVWRTLNESVLKFGMKKKVPYLKEHHKSDRVNFAKNILTNGPDMWSKIVFSDEKRFCLNGPDGYRYYWHDIREPDEYFILEKFSKGIMVWGAISMNGQKSLQFVEGKINSEKYQHILNEGFLTKWDTNDVLFQQDNASPHVSVSTRAWMEVNNIHYLEWPAISPDLNIIENIWGILTGRIYRNKSRYTSLDELKEAIILEWNTITNDEILGLFKSFPCRLTNVLCRNGKFLIK